MHYVSKSAKFEPLRVAQDRISSELDFEPVFFHSHVRSQLQDFNKDLTGFKEDLKTLK